MLINFPINLSISTVVKARSRLEQEGLSSLNDVIGDLLTAYALEDPVSLALAEPGSSMQVILTVDIEDWIIGEAQTRIAASGKSAADILVELVTGYAQYGRASTEPIANDAEEAGTRGITFEKKKLTKKVVKVKLVDGNSNSGQGGSTACQAIPGVNYKTITIDGRKTDRPANIHGDINLGLRGYGPTTAFAGLINMNGDTDPRAPQLYGLFADQRTPTFGQCYRVNEWNFGNPPLDAGTRGVPITFYDVTLIEMQTMSGETLHVPGANYTIGDGYQVLVLYAEENRITLKYTREDTVVGGYTLHMEDICVEPSLLTLYNQQGNFNRTHLPALKAGEAFGRAKDNTIKVALRDNGTIMDPRVRKDWWAGR